MVSDKVNARARMAILAAGAFQLLAILALSGIVGASPARAQAPQEDTNPLNSVLGFVGMQFDKDKDEIDYRARAPIVVPPHIGDLPKPKEATHTASWPNDPDVAERRHAAAAKLTPAPQSTPQARAELSPADLARSQGDLPGGGSGDDCQSGPGTPICLSAPLKVLQHAADSIPFIGKGSNADTILPTEEPPRTYLTEPPEGYRRPTAVTTVKADAPPKEKADAGDPGAYMRSQQRTLSSDSAPGGGIPSSTGVPAPTGVPGIPGAGGN